MKKGLILAFFLTGILLFASKSFAFDWGNGSGSTYNTRTGNSYNWSTDMSGKTDVNGMNLRTGTRWQTTIEPNGNQHGRDSKGNYWQYDESTGYYHNFGTGKTCTGQGYARRCW
ncbi:MAG: hypothetical protein M0Z52_02050 [Actinomycetota bacterium]|nr:hypothetical protein [Actinomycetota bacterium]